MMKIAKAACQGKIFYGELRDAMLHPIQGELFGSFSVSDAGIPLAEVRLLAPADPTKIVCVGRNYVDHVSEMVDRGIADSPALRTLPERPELFIKPNSAINDPGGDIIYPKDSSRVDYEGEIAVVIGRRGRYVRAEDAMDYIFGLTLLNDVSRRDRPKSESQWTNGKCYDTFCPIGPYITRVDSLEGIHIKTYHNGQLKQDSDTEHMIFKIPRIIQWITSRMTLMPGDIIATGTPSGVASVQAGDTVTVFSEELGTLTNQFVEERLPE